MPSVTTSTDVLSNPPPGVRVVCSCGRAVVSGEREQALSVPVDDSDWESVFELAKQHKMEILLLQTHRDEVSEKAPPDRYDEFRQSVNRDQQRSLVLSAELVDVVDLLLSNGIDVLAYKGPVVASRAYGNVSFRRFADLDLLVPPADRQSALELLEQRGFEQGAVKPHLFETVVGRPGGSVVFDLHTQIVPNYFPFKLPFDELYDRRTTVDIGGREVPALSTIDAVIAHSIHGSKHRWYRIEWVLAVAMLVQQVPNPTALLDRAEEIGCERMVLLALVLADRLFDAPVPQSLDRRLNEPSRSMQVVNQMADTTQEIIFSSEWADDAHDKRTHVSDVRLRWRFHSSWPMKLRFLIKILTEPREDDFEFVDLPASMKPLYRFVRPARLLYEYRQQLTSQVKR